MRWFHIGIKDVTVTLRDKAALGILMAMPIAMIVILGSALGNLESSLGKIPIAIVNLDKGSVGPELTDSFFTDDRLEQLFLARALRDPDEARAAVEKGDLTGALVVPADFTRRINTGRPAELVVYTDPGRQISAFVFRSVVEGVSTRVCAASVAARTSAFYIRNVRVSDPSFYSGVVGKAVASATESEALTAVELVETTATRGKEISNLTYYSGAMSVMFIMFGSMFGAFSLVRERDDWTLPRVMMTPASRLDILGGKVFGVFLVGLAQFALLYTFTSAIGVAWGDGVAVFLVAASTIAAATGMSVLIAAIGKTVRAVSGIAQLFIQAMAALGGSFFPVSQFPAWLQPLHYLTVNGWGIDGFLATMRGGTALDVLPNAGALLAIGLAFFLVGAARLRWE